jgi:tRNA-Thr(GGU) m(6)t(6)A37 methyltransferase TsaA
VTPHYHISPVGVIHNADDGAWIEIYDDYTDALPGIDGFSHLMVFFWFHHNDTPEGRAYLRVHPRKNPENPLTGVFATHSPLRPNLIGLTFCRLRSRSGNILYMDKIDAIDGTPLIDIKPHIPLDDLESATVSVPDWV